MTDVDFPWLDGRFVPQDDFESVQALFEEELELIEREGPFDVQRWEWIYRQITDRLSLVKPDGIAAAEFLLHIKDNNAWFRWSDEPFDTPPDE